MNITEKYKVKELQLIFHCYIDTVMCSAGVAMSILSLIVLFNSKFKENLYNYIRMEVINSGLSLFLLSFRSFLYCRNTLLNSYLAYSTYIISRYMRFVFEMNSIIYGILSSICFYSMLSNKNNLLSKYSYKIICLIVCFIDSLLFLFMLFEYDIVAYDLKYNNDNSTRVLYYQKESEFVKTKLHDVFRYGSFFLQNYVLGFSIFIINIAIFIKIKKLMKNKKSIQTTSGNSSSIQRTERSIKMMLYVNSANTIIFRIPRMIYFVFNDVLRKNIFDNSIYEYSTLILYLFISFSITIKFILFYLTNILFRTVFNQMIKRIFLMNFKNNTVNVNSDT